MLNVCMACGMVQTESAKVCVACGMVQTVCKGLNDVLNGLVT